MANIDGWPAGSKVPTEAPISLRQFLDAAARLRFVDFDEFQRALVGIRGDTLGLWWHAFSTDPVDWLRRAPATVAQDIWSLAQSAGHAPATKET
jgi:hypothetical protein